MRIQYIHGNTRIREGNTRLVMGIQDKRWEYKIRDGNTRYKWKYKDRDGKTKYRWEYKIYIGIRGLEKGMQD